ncbi:MAG: CapA family protein [Clostridium sp.]|nr:CapA family protein [Clostridium sp.]
MKTVNILKDKTKTGILVTILLIVIILTACGNGRKIDKANMTDAEAAGQAKKAGNTAEVFNETEDERHKKVNRTYENPDYSQITLSMIGDILLHTKINESGRMEDGSLNYDHLFANVKEDIKKTDIAIVNQEVILGGEELGLSGYPCFNGAYEVADALVNAGINVVLHATNHTLDKGKRGVLNCMNYWKTTHPQVAVLGINDSREAQDSNIFIFEKNDIKVAILNYTYGTNGIPLPADMPYIVNLIDKNKIEKDVNKAKELADFIIVTPHWGTEYMHIPSDSQRELAKYMAGLGVNLVIGAHPHVIQPVEWVKSDDGNETLVYYSLGNFINSTNETGDKISDRMIGAMAKVSIGKNKGEKAWIKDYSAVPLVTHMRTGVGLITTYKFEDYSAKLAEKNEIVKQDSNFSLKYCIDVWNDVFPKFGYFDNGDSN